MFRFFLFFSASILIGPSNVLSPECPIWRNGKIVGSFFKVDPIILGIQDIPEHLHILNLYYLEKIESDSFLIKNRKKCSILKNKNKLGIRKEGNDAKTRLSDGPDII